MSRMTAVREHSSNTVPMPGSIAALLQESKKELKWLLQSTAQRFVFQELRSRKVKANASGEEIIYQTFYHKN